MKGKSYEEVSQMLGISPSTINDHIVKATHTLREHMKRMDILGFILMMAAAGHM